MGQHRNFHDWRLKETIKDFYSFFSGWDPLTSEIFEEFLIRFEIPIKNEIYNFE